MPGSLSHMVASEVSWLPSRRPSWVIVWEAGAIPSLDRCCRTRTDGVRLSAGGQIYDNRIYYSNIDVLYS